MAGSIAGLSTVVMLQPLDVVKTRLQIEDGLGSLPRYGSTLHAFRVIVQSEGWKALYAGTVQSWYTVFLLLFRIMCKIGRFSYCMCSGLTPSLIGSTIAWGSYFWAYDTAKQTLKRKTGQQQIKQLGAVDHLMCAGAAGTFVSVITNPIWVVKTRLQAQSRHRIVGVRSDPLRSLRSKGEAPFIPYAGFFDCFVKISRKEGLRGLYKGLLPSLFLVSHGAIQFTAYEDLKERIPAARRAFASTLSLRPSTGIQSPELDSGPSSFDIASCGALSKLVATFATYPSQVLRSRLQQRMDIRALRYAGVVDTFRQTLSREGVGGFYKGLLPHVLRVMPQSAITFLVYETIIQLIM